jgi:hypothetical protein
MPDEINAKAIVKELDYLPLAIEHAAGLLRLNRFTLSTFVQGYRQHYHRITNEKLPKGLFKYEKSLCLFTLIKMLHSTIQEESPEAAALLTLLGFLGQWQFTLNMFRENVQSDEKKNYEAVINRLENTHLNTVLIDDFLLSLAISHLSNACLIKNTGKRVSSKSVSVHNIICQWIFETTAEKEQWVLAAALILSAHTLISQEMYDLPLTYRK